METQKTDKSIYLLLALTTALWGSLYTANKVLLEAVSALSSFGGRDDCFPAPAEA